MAIPKAGAIFQGCVNKRKIQKKLRTRISSGQMARHHDRDRAGLKIYTTIDATMQQYERSEAASICRAARSV